MSVCARCLHRAARLERLMPRRARSLQSLRGEEWSPAEWVIVVQLHCEETARQILGNLLRVARVRHELKELRSRV